MDSKFVVDLYVTYVVDFVVVDTVVSASFKMINSQKFARSKNFTTKEENVLLGVVKKYKQSVECKRSDANTNKIKNEAWVKVAQEFNIICGEMCRDVKTLKNKYENIKKRSKQKFADEKRYVTGTGGGAPKDIVITQADNAMLEIIGQQLTGQEPEFDDDAVEGKIEVVMQKSDEETEFQITEDDFIEEVATDNEVPMDTQWLPCSSASLLRTPKSSVLNTNPNLYESDVMNSNNDSMGRKRPTAKNAALGFKLEEWAKAKVSLAEVQKECYIQEHSLKMKLMKDKFEKEIKLLEKESEDRRKWALKEHEANLTLKNLEQKLIVKKLNE